MLLNISFDLLKVWLLNISLHLLGTFSGVLHLSHGHVAHGRPLRLPHPEGGSLGHLQRQQGRLLGKAAQGSRLSLPLSKSLNRKTGKTLTGNRDSSKKLK